MDKVLIIGGVGAASTIAYAMIDAQKKGYDKYKFCGFINDKDNVEEIQGYPVLGGLDDIPRFIDQGYFIINTVYKIDGQVYRVELFDSLNIPTERLPIFIHPDAYVGENVNLGPGSVVMPNASLSSGSKCGICCRVMSGAMVGHDNHIGDHSFFAANTTIGSHNNIGEVSYFGLNSTVGGKLEIGKYSVVGMGSVITKDIKPYEIWIGNPAKKFRDVKDKPSK